MTPSSRWSGHDHRRSLLGPHATPAARDRSSSPRRRSVGASDLGRVREARPRRSPRGSSIWGWRSATESGSSPPTACAGTRPTSGSSPPGPCRFRPIRRAPPVRLRTCSGTPGVASASSPTPTSWPRCSFAGTTYPSSPRSSCSTPFRMGSTTASSSASTSSVSVGGRGSSPIPTWCTIEWRRSPTTRSRRSSTRAGRPEPRRAPCSRTATSEPRSMPSRPWSRSGPTIGSCRSCRSRTSRSAS